MAPTRLDMPTPGARMRLVGYSLPAIPLAIMIVPVTALIPIYYTDEFGFSLTTVGAILLIARLFDVITDPVVGVLSDRTRHSAGRRRPWMIAGAPVLVLGVFILFAPPVAPNSLYLLGAALLTYGGWTLIQIPYWSWGAEIAQEYDARAIVSGYRETAMIFGIAAASLAPVIASQFGHGIDRTTMFWLAVMVAVLTPVAILIAARSFSEETVYEANDRAWSSILAVFRRNPPFRHLLFTFAIIELGKGAAVSVTAYFLTYYFRQPELIGLVLLLPYLCIIASAPLWVALSKRIGKHRAVAISLLSAALTLMCIAFLDRDDGYVFLALECIVGLAAGGFAVLPTAIVADVADYFADETDGDTAIGAHFASWSLVRKFVQAGSIGMALPLLSLIGFNPNNDPEINVTATKWIFIGLSTPFYFLGVVLMLKFPLTKAVHDAIRQRLEGRRNSAPSKERADYGH
ncbi:MAG: MFS transporter [Pseudomonadota bacterium]